ncbi:MAG: BON domain-containing protein [Reyranellaceae bacterium]
MTNDYPGEARMPAGPRPCDEEIRRQVLGVLDALDDIDASGVECAVSDGCVTLRGGVATSAEMERIESLACEIAGVTSLLNCLVPREAAPSAAELPGDGAAARMGKPDFER